MTFAQIWDLWREHYLKTSGNRLDVFQLLPKSFQDAWLLFIQDVWTLAGDAQIARDRDAIAELRRVIKDEMLKSSRAVWERDGAMKELVGLKSENGKLKKKLAELSEQSRPLRSPRRLSPQIGSYERLDYVRNPLSLEDVLRQPGYGRECPLSIENEERREDVEAALNTEPVDVPVGCRPYMKRK